MSHVSDGALHAYLDGESTERERAQVEKHLTGCEACRERLEEATALSRAASDLLTELEPAGISTPSWREIEERSRVRRRGPVRRSWVRPALAWAASIAIAFGIGWFSRSYWSELASPDALATRSAPSAERISPVAAPAVGEMEAEPEATGRRRSEESDADVGRPIPDLDEMEKAARQSQALADEAIGSTPPPAEPAEQRRDAYREAPARNQGRAKEEPQAAAGVQPTVAPESTGAVVERLEKENRAAALDRLPGELAPPEGESAQRLVPAAAPSEAAESFLNVSTEHAAQWLGVPLRTLPELRLTSTEVGPGSTMEYGSDARPAIRMRYLDAAGNEIVLIQQWTGETKVGAEEPSLVIEPSGLRSYRWYDSGYHLVLQGRVSGDSLRALAERVR